MPDSADSSESPKSTESPESPEGPESDDEREETESSSEATSDSTETEPEPQSKSESPPEPVVTDAEPPAAEDDSAPEAESDSAPSISPEEVRASVEALLYASGEPLPLRAMKKAMREAKDLVAPALEALSQSYAEDGRGLQIVEVAGGWQITTRPEYHERVRRLFDNPRPPRLSIQALETLAVIAYRQPITVPEIVALRGVRSAGVVRTLLERKLIRMLGRKKVVGLPLLYGTTKEFLLRFGLKSLKDLPQLKDMSEVFGDEVAEQLEVLDALEPPTTEADIVPLEANESAESHAPSVLSSDKAPEGDEAAPEDPREDAADDEALGADDASEDPKPAAE